MELPVATYAPDLRDLVVRSFPAELGPVQRVEPLPGALIRRLQEYDANTSAAGSVCLRGASEAEKAVPVPPADYFVMAARARAFAVGVFLDIASVPISDEDRRASETAVLSELERLEWLVVPPPVLGLLQQATTTDPGVGVWLERATRELFWLESDADIRGRRAELRVDILRAGSRGVWSDVATTVVELAIDLVYLSRICALDIRRASADSGGGRISSALAELDDRHDLLFESHLPHAITPAEITVRIPAAESDWLGEFQMARAGRGLLGATLLQDGVQVEPIRKRAETAIRAAPATAGSDRTREEQGAKGRDGSAAVHGEVTDPSGSFRRILAELKQRMVAEDDIIHELALIATEHLHLRHEGTAPRVLLTGASGSGKTHSTRAFTDALRQVAGEGGVSAYELYCPDLSATGWRGLDLPDAVSDLREMSGAVRVLALQEVDKLAILGRGADGNSREAKANLQASLLGLLEGSALRPDLQDEQPTSDILVLGTGAFGDRFSSPPSDRALVEWGFSAELASRWTNRIHFRGARDPEAALRLLEHSTAHGLRSDRLAEVFGYSVEYSPAALRYIARRIVETGENYRTVLSRLDRSVRRKLIARLRDSSEGARVLLITPDDLDR